MKTALQSINRERKPLNILMQAVHEGYTDLIAQTNHNFYMLQGDGMKTWDYHTRDLPKNVYLINKKNYLPPDIKVDILLSQERFGNLQKFIELRGQTGIPVVHIDHALPHPGWSNAQIQDSKNLKADANVYITNLSKKAWSNDGSGSVIYYGIDTEVFKGYTGEVEKGVSIVNHFAQRDVFCGWELWKTIVKEVPITLIGENPGLSESIKDKDVLVKRIAESRFFLNTSLWSTFPLTIAEAMACGCPIVTTNQQEIPYVVKHGYNGFLSNDPQELIQYCKLLLKDKELATVMSINARKTAEEMFGLTRFVNAWNEVLYGVLGI